MHDSDFEDEPTNVVLRWDGSDKFYSDNQELLDVAFWLGMDLDIEARALERKR